MVEDVFQKRINIDDALSTGHGMLFSQRLAIDQAFEEDSRNNGNAYCVQNFLVWLPRSKWGHEIIRRLQEEVDSL